jgi:hypothetical protein
MALFKVKRTTKPGVVPVGLTYGELAVNITDKKLYVGGASGQTVEILGASGSGGGIGSTAGIVYSINGISPGSTGNAVVVGASTWDTTEPTVASNLSGVPAGTTFGIGTSAISILKSILYPYQNVSFSSFSMGLAQNTFDLGQTSAAGTYSVTWTTSGPNTNWVAGTITVRDTTNSTAIASGLNYNSSPYSASLARYRYTPPTTVSFSLTGQQASGSVVSTSTSYTWAHRIYWGKSAADPTSISDLSYGSNRYTSGRLTLGSYQYTISASPSALACYVVVPTSPGSMNSYTTWTDASGFTLNPTSGTFTEYNTHGVSISWTWYKVSNPTTAQYIVNAS